MTKSTKTSTKKAAPTKEAVKEAPKPEVKARDALFDMTGVQAEANPSLIVWPADPWGMCSDLRKAIVAAGSRVGGQTDKWELLVKNLMVGLAHLDAKFAADKLARNKFLKELEAKEGK